VYKIAADTPRIIGVAPEYFKRITVKPVKAILGSKPQEPLFILQAADYGIIGKPVLHLEMAEVIRLPANSIHYQQESGKYDRFVVQ
jgi:hypothetical protein